MSQVLRDILSPIVLTKVISERVAASGAFLRMFGMQPGGPNEVNEGHGREGAYHVFNNTIKTAAGRAPGLAAARIAGQGMSKVKFDYPRMHSSIPLLAETYNNIARIDDPALRDKAGINMIKRQTDHLAKLACNWRTAMLVGMLRGSLYYLMVGDSYYIQYDSSNSATEIPQLMPAGNKSKLNMLGAGDIIGASWSDVTTDIPTQWLKINAAFQVLNGSGLERVMMQSQEWGYFIQNNYVAKAHGTSAQPFKIIEERTETGPDGKKAVVWTAKVSFMPWVDIIITDEGLEIGKPGSETYKKHIPDNSALFLGSDVSGGDLQCYIGGEPIAEYDGGPEDMKYGAASWSRKLSNPTSTEIFVLDNALPVNHVPKNVAVGLVTF